MAVSKVKTDIMYVKILKTDVCYCFYQLCHNVFDVRLTDNLQKHLVKSKEKCQSCLMMGFNQRSQGSL